MPFISVTRLSVRSLRFLLSFLWQTLKVARQAQHSSHFLSGRILREAKNTFRLSRPGKMGHRCAAFGKRAHMAL